MGLAWAAWGRMGMNLQDPCYHTWHLRICHPTRHVLFFWSRGVGEGSEREEGRGELRNAYTRDARRHEAATGNLILYMAWYPGRATYLCSVLVCGASAFCALCTCMHSTRTASCPGKAEPAIGHFPCPTAVWTGAARAYQQVHAHKKREAV
jgi:hypothetical protein